VETAILIEAADVSGAQPAVVAGREVTRAGGHLAGAARVGVVDAHLHARHRPARNLLRGGEVGGREPSVVLGGQAGDRAGLRSAVHVEEVDAGQIRANALQGRPTDRDCA
jgi:hypothetical protein